MLIIQLPQVQFFLVLSYLIVDKMLPGVEGRDILALSIVMILTGLTLIVMRSRAIMQMVGLITMEMVFTF